MHVDPGTGFVRADLQLSGRAVLVAGAGPAALGPVAALREAGAAVTVIGPVATDSIADLAHRRLIDFRAGEPSAADVRSAALVVAATGDPETDRGVHDLARACGVPSVGSHGAGGRSAQPDAPITVADGPRGGVVLVGGGPGDPRLLTIAGLAAIRTADVLVVDRLAPLAALDEARPGTVIIDVAKIPRGAFTPQDEINRLLVEHARAGRRVVRLKGGDIFVFGRGGEEWQACVAAGVPVELIPGVSASIAGPALAGIPVTHRTLSQGFTVVSGHLPPDDPGSTVDWSALAGSGTTLVVLMGMRNLAAICGYLIEHGMDPATPAATVADAGLPDQRSVRAPLEAIARETEGAGLVAPAIIVIGSVAGFRPDQPA